MLGIIKNIARYLLGLTILVSAATNINNQLSALVEAEKSNRELEKRIEEISEENRKLQGKIAEATQSAVIEAKIREKLGLGTTNDYWLKLPKEGTVLK